MNMQFVTGTDDRLFLYALILLQSFANAGAADAIKVCDFGLTAGQRSFLKSHNKLLVAETPLPSNCQHPIYKKAALVDYIPYDIDAVMWLDADVMLTGKTPLLEVAALIHEMNNSGAMIAACADQNNLDLGSFFSFFQTLGHNTAPFVELLDRLGVALDHRYLNSGVFITTSREWLLEWKSVTLDTKEPFLVEQNIFNVLAWRTPERVRILDNRRWNVHGSILDQISIGAELASLHCDGQEVMVLHATAPDKRHVEPLEGSGKLGDRRIPVHLRLFGNQRLRAQQFALLDAFIKLHEAELIEHLYAELK